MKAATLALSISAHAAVALMAAHGGSSSALSALADARRVELPAPELVVDEVRSVETSSTEPVRAAAEGHRASHTHPYPVPADHDVTPHDPSMLHIPLPGTTADRTPAPPPVVLDAPAAPARFVLAVGRPTTGPTEAVSANGGRESEIPPGIGAPFTEEAVDTAATLLSGNAPTYTREAESAGVETEVPLEIVVDDGGNVVSARALQHVGYGLDAVAQRSIRGYRFKPARRAGNPVAVRMRWLVRFELR